MEELKTVRKWFQRGFVCMGMDLKDAFLHVPMRPEVNKFLQFAWKEKTLQMAGFTLRLKVFSKNIDLHGKSHSCFPSWQEHYLDSLHG